MSAGSQQLSTGQRVKYVGMFGKTDGPTGRVSRVCKGFIRVRLDNGSVEDFHPNDIRAVTW